MNIFTRLKGHPGWGRRWMAVVFVNEEDRRIFKELVLVLKTAGAPIPREIANSRYTTSVCVGRERKRKLSSSF
jgi:ATP-dependent RNA helicase DDX59